MDTQNDTPKKPLKPHAALANRRGTITSFTAAPGLINLVNKYCAETNMTRSELIRELLAQLVSAHYGETVERVLAMDFAHESDDEATDENV